MAEPCGLVQRRVRLGVRALCPGPGSVMQEQGAHCDTRVSRAAAPMAMLDGKMQRWGTLAGLVKIPTPASQEEFECCKVLLSYSHMDAMLSSTTVAPQKRHLKEGQGTCSQSRLDIVLKLPSQEVL